MTEHMDDIDDFIVDDITLDDETLALLDEEEQKYLTAQKNELLDAPPVSKKRKLDTGWGPGHLNPDDEDLPEISVQEDGTYDVRDVVRNTSVSTPRNPLNVSNVDNSGFSTRTTTAVIQCFDISTAPSTTQQHSRDSTSAENAPAIALRPGSPYSRETGQDAYFEHQLQLLQRKFHELSEENQRMQIDLEKATDLKLTKEGEVTILRKDLERAAQDHAARIANLKAAKEEADAKQTQLRKDMEGEIARLKDQLTFKHHESDSSLRRVQHSARTSRIYKDPLKTPVRRFSQLASETPRPCGPVFGQGQEFGQHIETLRIKRPKSPRKINSSGALPGFQNAFLSSPLNRARTDVIVEGSPPGSPMARSPPSSPTAQLVRSSNNFGIGEHPDLSQYRSHMVIENDIEFVMVEDEEKSQALEPIFLPINWASELSRIVLTHSLPGSIQPTLQVLLMTSSSLVEVDATEFAAACSNIFEVLANTSTILDHNMTRRLSCLLVKMLFIVGCSEQYCSIRSLVHLLTTLVRSVPDFGPYLLSRANPCKHFSLPDAVREIVTRHLSSAKKTDFIGALANETLGLLEALCLCTTDDIIAELSPLVEDGQVWAALLRSVHGESLLTRACRLLVLFGSRPTLARALINVSSVQSKDGDTLERLSLIDRLCTFLYETIGSSECNEIREHILSFFATISLTHLDSHAALTNSDVLIPSLVYLSSNLANPLWEEDGSVLQNLATLIKMIKQTVTLIHHLVFGTESSPSLGLRLHHNSRRVLNGLNHMFIVCFGRLSYADPPGWIDKTQRHELESLSDMARELLDLVVDGPESDSIWSLYQEDPDKNESEMDEGEIEARLMGD